MKIAYRVFFRMALMRSSDAVLLFFGYDGNLEIARRLELEGVRVGYVDTDSILVEERIENVSLRHPRKVVLPNGMTVWEYVTLIEKAIGKEVP